MIGKAVVKRVFTVKYHQLDRWSVAFFRSVNWQWPKEFIRPIGVALRRVQRIVTTDLSETPIIQKISFGGELSVLDEEKRAEYKGRLFKAESGQLIYSKIRVKQGSVCIVPSSIEWVAVSSEYPVYEIDSNVADPKYLELVLRSTSFKHYLDGLSHGGSTKTRIHPDQFEELKVPIPPPSIQQKIVEYWENAVMQHASFEKERLNLIEECHSFTLDYLGIKKNKAKRVGKIFCLHWKDSERWSYEYNKRMFSGLSSVQTGSYPTKPLGKICKGVSGSTPSKKNQEYWRNGILPWVSPKDMKYRIISNSIDYISQKAIEDRQAPTVTEGSILFVVRSGILQHTVPVSITKSKVSINQDIRAFTPQSKEVLGDYLLAYFEAKQNELLRLVKWSTTVQSINKEELEQFPIPLPPIHKQEDIILNVSKYHREINALSERREKSILKTKNDIEKMILGTLSVEEL